MKNSPKINNLHDLQAEIARLNLRRREQEAYLTDQYNLLKIKISAPIRFFRLVTSHVPGVNLVKDLTSSISKAAQRKDADWLTRVLQLGAPIVLNSTVLKRAGWFKKAMVLLASETAIGQVNQDKISGLVSKITSFIKPKKKKKKKKIDAEIEKIAVMEQQAAILEDERFTDKT
ncbi:hypothetical protein [Sphingobacterium chuzhouense]|uniref:Uncharacterized protein n=1 Tax=Sphingobacterium chuzhouense TaxID=1742264 RepID=A0ABR7XXV5_9SPHI|nr:hypothetical protein [Sphingobacterium chuzhouense]MBD1423862.1 hypothetical protein [Sphingobacterium chuzhouense]